MFPHYILGYFIFHLQISGAYLYNHVRCITKHGVQVFLFYITRQYQILFGSVFSFLPKQLLSDLTSTADIFFPLLCSLAGFFSYSSLFLPLALSLITEACRCIILLFLSAQNRPNCSAAWPPRRQESFYSVCMCVFGHGSEL